MKLESSIVKTKIRAANFSLLLKELEEIKDIEIREYKLGSILVLFIALMYFLSGKL